MKKTVLLICVLSLLAISSFAAAPVSITKFFERLYPVTTASDDVRNVAISKDNTYLVAVNRQAPNDISVLASTPGLPHLENIDVSTSGITTGLYKLLEVEFSGDGGMFMCSLSYATAAPLDVWYWSDINAHPVNIFSSGATWLGYRMGDAMDVTGNVSDNSVVVYITGNNAASLPLKLTTPDAGLSWASSSLVNPIKAVEIRVAPSGNIWAADGAIIQYSAAGLPLATTGLAGMYGLEIDEANNLLYTMGLQANAVLDIFDVTVPTAPVLVASLADPIDAGVGSPGGFFNGSAEVRLIDTSSGSGTKTIYAHSERNGIARYAFGSTILVDGVGAAYPAYATIDAAIKSYASGGDNYTTPVKPLIINIDPAGGPYDEALDMDDSIPGNGDFPGDIVLQSLTPGTLPVLKIQNGSSSDGIVVWQADKEVTFKELLFCPSLTNPFSDDMVRVEENTGSATIVNWVNLIDCVLTEIDLAGNPLVTSKAAAIAAAATPQASCGGNAGRTNSYPSLFQIWSDATEPGSAWLENCTLNNDVGGSIYAAACRLALNNALDYIYINDTAITNNLRGAGIRFSFGGGATLGNSGVAIYGTDAGAGPTAATYIRGANTDSWHNIWGSAGTGSCIINNMISDATVDTTNRTFSNGSTRYVDIDDSILYGGIVVDGTSGNPGPVTWSRNTLPGFYNVSAGPDQTCEDTIFTGRLTGSTSNFVLVNCGYPLHGPDAIGADVGVISSESNSVVWDPVFLSYDSTSANYLDVQNEYYGAAGTGGSDLAGGADYVGGTAALPLAITEIMDGTWTSGTPKFTEITNIGPVDVDLSLVDLARDSNGGGAWTRVQLSGSLGPGESYVSSGAYNSGEAVFINTFGFAPDQADNVSDNNGDDPIAILKTGTGPVIDIYGVFNVDGTGSAWEYLDTRVYRLTPAAPNATFTAAEWIINPINDLDGATTPALAQIANPAAYDNNLRIADQIGEGSDLDDTTTPVLTFAPAADDILTSWGLTFSAPVRGLHGAATGGLAVFTDGIDVGPNNLDGLLFDANGDDIPSGLQVDLTSQFPYGAAIDQINMWSRNTTGSPDARIFINCHIFLDTTDDATFNPTFYGEAVTGGPGAAGLATEDWTALYITDDGGFMRDAAVYGILLDLYSVTDAGANYRAEGQGGGGSIIKEIDVFGDVQAVIPPTSVGDWVFFE